MRLVKHDDPGWDDAQVMASFPSDGEIVASESWKERYDIHCEYPLFHVCQHKPSPDLQKVQEKFGGSTDP